MRRIIVAVLLASCSAGTSAAVAPRDAGTYYTHGQLGIKKLAVVNGVRIDITFDPVQEQFHWCPGIKVQETKKATVVTFVRCKTSKTCAVDRKAKIGRKLIRTVSIDVRGKDVYVRNGTSKYKRIHTILATSKKTKSGPKSKSGAALRTGASTDMN